MRPYRSATMPPGPSPLPPRGIPRRQERWRAQLLLAESGTPGEVYNVASGEEVSMRQLVQVIEEATGYPADVDNITAITDDTYRLVSDFSKLRALGYVPQVHLADGIAQLAEHLGQNPELPSRPSAEHLASASSLRSWHTAHRCQATAIQESRGACGNASADAASAAPWPLSGGCALA